ncbi:LexA family transcriptional regulator [Hyphomicrobium sp.]|uniref:LexA family transcriptional regulator n=1 Tax=Hyphomicrobium sp. TaxID=82 RepID=UPI001D73CE86|nr:LexA family transcriptional regulator [Hyphomicrobium sp.]MBY0561456.1 LexA family transcriptional regulator [Hyphomicrobium sp.]
MKNNITAIGKRLRDPRKNSMQNELIAIGKRLKEARKQADMTQQQVARVLGLSKQSICHYELARAELSITDMSRLAVIYGCSIDYILTGNRGSKEGGSVGKLKVTRGRFVPKIRYDDIIKFAIGDVAPEEVQERRQCYADCSNKAISVEIFDNAMDGGRHPIMQGDVITIDPAVQPDPGDCFLIGVPKSGDLFFRRYKASGLTKKLTAPFKLSADNPGYDDIEIAADTEFVFLGTLVEHVRLIRR